MVAKNSLLNVDHPVLFFEMSGLMGGNSPLKLDRQNMNFLSQSWSAKLGSNFEGQLLS
jgi:hypothetical protein